MQKFMFFIIISVIGLWAAACSDTQESIHFTYVNNSGEITITGLSSSETTRTELVIPETIEGNPVVAIGNHAFYNNTYLINVDMSQATGLTSIGPYTFRDCTSLKNVTLPASLTTIDEGTFYNCNSLTGLILPAGLTTIGEGAFRSCTSLKSMDLPAGLTSINDYVFNNCIGLTNVTLPAGLTSIGIWAFGYCSGLTNIALPAGLTSIGYCTFYDCYSLTNVALPAGLTSIGDSAFVSCISMKSVTLPINLSSIGESAFWGCSSLTTVNAYRTTPPAAGNGIFDSCPLINSIHVPSGSMSAYQTASVWSNYSALIVGDL